MAGQVHAQFEVVAKIEVKGVPDHLEHAGNHVPNLVRDDEVGVGVRTGGVERLLARKMDGDVADLLFGQLGGQLTLDRRSDLLGDEVLGRGAHALKMLGFHGDVTVGANALDRDGYVHE